MVLTITAMADNRRFDNRVHIVCALIVLIVALLHIVVNKAFIIVAIVSLIVLVFFIINHNTDKHKLAK